MPQPVKPQPVKSVNHPGHHHHGGPHTVVSVSVATTEIAPSTAAPAPENWFLTNTDWPALLLNLVVLGLAIYGVLQAQAANRRAKETEYRLFQEARFKRFDEGLQRWKYELQTTVQLVEDLLARTLSDADFHTEVDHAGQMIFGPLLRYGQHLSEIDSEGSFGQGWRMAFDPYQVRLDTAYDLAHDGATAPAAKRTGMAAVAAALREGFHALAEFEFNQRRSWGKRP